MSNPINNEINKKGLGILLGYKSIIFSKKTILIITTNMPTVGKITLYNLFICL